MKLFNNTFKAGLAMGAALLVGCTSVAAENSNTHKATSPMKQIAMQAQDAFFKEYDAEKMQQYLRED